jgi:ABC-type transport system substrate-binding protein
LADQGVRQAIFAALDPQAAIAASIGIGWVGTGLPAIEPSWVLDEPLIAGAFGARELAVTVDVRPLTLTIGNFGEYHVAHGEAIAAQLTAAGFDVTTEVISRGAYLDRVWERRDYDLFVGPMPPTDTPSAFLLALLHTRGASNVTGAGTAALDALIEAQAVELDDGRREDMVRNIQAGALDGAWFFMAAGLSERWAFNERVVSPPLAFPVGSGDWWKYVAVVEPAP